MFSVVTVTTLLTGTMFLMWLGEQITERGLGNGISIIDLCWDRRRLAEARLRSVGTGENRGYASVSAIFIVTLLGGVGHRFRGLR
jgi:preprotein translocase subunit SecY